MNKFLKFHLNIKLQKISRYFYLLAVIAVLVCLFFSTKFLYNNFYLSITQSREVVVLKEKVAPETINIDAFEDVMENIKTKTERKSLKITSNPF